MAYKTNYIVNAFYRIDFSPLLLLKESLKADYQEAMRNKFPIFESMDMTTKKIEMGKDLTEKTSEIFTFKQWSFFNKEKTIKVSSCYNFFIVEFNKYSSFDEFESVANDTFTNFKRFYEPLAYKRFGLRYVNNIVIRDGDPLNWSDYLLPFLAKPIEDFPLKENLSRVINQFIINKGNYTLMLNSGILNKEYPDKISRREYLLDIDCSTKNCDSEDPLNSMRKYHEEIENLFEKCITDNLRTLMGVE